MRTVQFFSEGLPIAATLRTGPTGGSARRPAIICAQGFSLTRDVFMPQFAEAFVKAGYVTLNLDYRGFGESGGEPRCRLLPLEQARDLGNAITWLQQQPEVDPERIGLFGISLGASVALQTAGTDVRVRAVVCCAGPGDLERVWSAFPDFARFRAKVDAAKREFVNTGKVTYVSVPRILSADPDTCALLVRDQPKHPTWRLEITFESLADLFAFKPENVAQNARASLFIYPAEDALIAKGEVVSMYAKAREPKQLVALEGMKHHEVYGDGRAFEPVLDASLDFFAKRL
ncbi:MAG: alpha/beta fold hydrolase [Myxococcaceae bacterium]|nr:alpha/beta fold hydrolase [Myxococcaceae bacterium]